ncbi:cobyrinate a,c-diamide synthase [Candidatus Poribacteria bacterium]|nr:cobyrinate a,c-diamide synthase [Candidatus Poribacteria bacterium]
MNYPRLVISGTKSGVGKTTLVLGIMLALKKRGYSIQPFKVGPDYIDPTYHTEITGRACRNLDTWIIPGEVILELFARQADNVDISIIEGVMGLYDGIKDKDEGSTAYLAKLINSPVILILDASSMSRSAAAMVLGYKEFDKQIDLRGVILNNIGSENHYNIIKNAIEKNTKIHVLGFLPKEKDMALSERHLGLIPAYEKKVFNNFNEKLLNLIEKNIDIDKLIKISKNTKKFPKFNKTIFKKRQIEKKVNIAIARDKAFNFYYEDSLDILKNLGANLIEFSPMNDKKLPYNIDGIYIGGGFPELYASILAKNNGLKKEIYDNAKNGLPIYAECGGLMYLTKELIDFTKKKFSMVGVFNASVNMANSKRALGYVEVKTLKNNILSSVGDENRAHVFHWSYLDAVPAKTEYSYALVRNDEPVSFDGLIYKNVLASYVHIHFASNIKFAENFIESCMKYKKRMKE